MALALLLALAMVEELCGGCSTLLGAWASGGAAFLIMGALLCGLSLLFGPALAAGL